MRAVLLSLRLAVASAVAVLLALLVQWAGPDVESAAAPVLAGQRVDQVERGPGLACWTWHLDKRREAVATDTSFTIRTRDAVYAYQEVKTVADSEAVSAALINRPVKPGQWSRKCIRVPDGLDGPFRVTGVVTYRTALTGAFWSVMQPVAEVPVP